MSAGQLTYTLVWPLAAIGLAAIGLTLWRRLRLLRQRPSIPLSMLVLVQNHADVLEGFLRTLLDFRTRLRGRLSDQLVVLDLGSLDDTPAIVERLAREIPGLYLLRAERRGCTCMPVIETAMGYCQTPAIVVLDLREGAPLPEMLAGLEHALLATQISPHKLEARSRRWG